MSAAPDALKLLGSIVAIVVAAIALNVVQDRQLTRRRQAALRQFDEWLASPRASAFGLEPGNCEVVGELAPSRRGAAETYALTLYLRDASGTYFLYIAQEHGPFVKPMTPEIARIVLKDRWRA